MPRLLIIQKRPPTVRVRTGVRCASAKRRLVGAVMPYLAALAPPGWDVRLLDDEIEEPDYNAPVDVVSDMFPQLRVPETTPLRSTVMRSQSRWISSGRCDM